MHVYLKMIAFLANFRQNKKILISNIADLLLNEPRGKQSCMLYAYS